MKNENLLLYLTVIQISMCINLCRYQDAYTFANVVRYLHQFHTGIDIFFLFRIPCALVTLSQKWVAISDALERNNKVLRLCVKSKVEDMYIKACEVKNWYVIRHCAAILQKTQHSLCDDVTHLLVNQMQISFGFDSEEETITQPPSASAMFNFCIQT